MRRPSQAEQRELALAPKATQQTVSAEVIRTQRDFLAALNLQINVSGLDDKELYIPLEIDAAHWSRIRKGDAHFPLNKLGALCDLCGNEITLDWFAWSRGKGLVMLESEAQRLLREANETIAEKDTEIRILRDVAAGRTR